MKKTIIEGDSPEQCFVCGHYGPTDVHHILHGSRRKAADKYGLTVHLCRDCHHRVHNGDTALDKVLKMYAQTIFEEKYDHDKWMEVFGKDYTAE